MGSEKKRKKLLISPNYGSDMLVQASGLFLNKSELVELTGVSIGRRGSSREELQCAWLRSVGIAFWVNARGAPVVTRSAIEGRKAEAASIKPVWVPRVISS